MRHRLHFRKLNRTAEHRWALRRNMAQSFFEHGRLVTTLPKAKNLQPFLERLITLAVESRTRAGRRDAAGSLGSRRRIDKLMGDRVVIPAQHRSAYVQLSDASRAKTLRMASGRRYRTGEPRGRLDFTADSAVHCLIQRVAGRMEGRKGGYTRLIRLAEVRLGDAAPLAMLQLVGDETAPLSVTKPKKSARRRRADSRYALAIQLTKASSSRSKSSETATSEPTEATG